MDRFLEVTRAASSRAELHESFVVLVQQVTGSPRVEFRPVGGPRRVRLCGSPRDIIRAKSNLEWPLFYRGEPVGMLSIAVGPGCRLSRSMEDCLRSLCSLAAMADRVLAREYESRFSNLAQGRAVTHPRAILLPFLRQLVLLARRRREPLTIMAIGLDASVLHDRPADAHEMTERVANAVIGAIRESDLLVRDDDRTLVTVLPNSSAGNAPWIAESIVRAVAESQPEPAEGTPTASVSVGGSTYPDDARDAGLLLDIAFDALRRAMQTGPGRVVVANQEARPPQVIWPNGFGPASVRAS